MDFFNVVHLIDSKNNDKAAFKKRFVGWIVNELVKSLTRSVMFELKLSGNNWNKKIKI